MRPVVECLSFDHPYGIDKFGMKKDGVVEPVPSSIPPVSHCQLGGVSKVQNRPQTSFNCTDPTTRSVSDHPYVVVTPVESPGCT